VNRDFQQFVHGSIETTQPFVPEATIRNDISFEQSKMAKTRGFHVSMRCVVLDTMEKRIERVKARGAHRQQRRRPIRRFSRTLSAILPVCGAWAGRRFANSSKTIPE
jgi:predicted ABC-type ATPase